MHHRRAPSEGTLNSMVKDRLDHISSDKRHFWQVPAYLLEYRCQAAGRHEDEAVDDVFHKQCLKKVFETSSRTFFVCVYPSLHKYVLIWCDSNCPWKLRQKTAVRLVSCSYLIHWELKEYVHIQVEPVVAPWFTHWVPIYRWCLPFQVGCELPISSKAFIGLQQSAVVRSLVHLLCLQLRAIIWVNCAPFSGDRE